ncbi:vanillyl alcohol oxidase [Plenodomus tracheiphilus IPT5]|uniref:Vanillyl alcohol oxidase n=1 Tax=Plenodomus tracheiphilus IPT5 TaxID=1408161 RepID=A0A6A7ATG1_9PLEO|nr:vanillyl alcohol oxidase [Plenodomus tracheiphilus IPT5]
MTSVRDLHTLNNDAFVLPPDVSVDDFRKALIEMAKVVGDGNAQVYTAQTMKHDESGHYFDIPKEHDLFYVLEKDVFLASAVISPGCVDEVSQIVKLANRYLIPLWPTSMGRNLGYGGAAPRLRGSVVLDMGARMNKVLEVNRRDCTCLIEPGVSYFSLYEYLQTNGFQDLWIDSPDLGGGSVMGNALDRGSGYTPYGDHFSMHCGMEVVLPTGEILRTGMGALPESNTWQTFQYVTKMGFWLMPDPGGYEAYVFSFQHDGDLPAIVETIRELRIKTIIQNAPTIRSTLIDAAVYAPKSHYTSSKDILTDAEIDVIAKDIGVGRWNVYGAMYGPKPMRELQWQALKDAFMQIPGTRYEFAKPRAKDEKQTVLHMREETLRGIPNTYELGWLNWTCGERGSLLGFSPISPATGVDADKQYGMVRKRFAEFGFDYIGTFVVGWRELHHIVCLTFDKTDAAERKRAHRCIELLIDDAAKEGYGEYRTHLCFMDQIASVYNWGNGASKRFNEQLKDSLDPNGILAPGKSGVWPARLRGRGFELERTTEFFWEFA